MQITDIRVRLLSRMNKMRGIASITIDGVFVIHDIKIIEGDHGLFIAMPSRKSVDGTFRDIAHPINSETRDIIQRMVIKRYEEVLLEQDDED